MLREFKVSPRMKSHELTCVLVCFYWREWKGEQLWLLSDWGLRIVFHVGNDICVGGRQCGDTALRNKRGFLWSSQVMLCQHSISICWMNVYTFISDILGLPDLHRGTSSLIFIVVLGAHWIVTYPVDDQEFRASICWNLNSLVIKRFLLTRFDPTCQVCWRRKWQPTPVFLPGESQGRGSLVGFRLWGHTESDTTEAT